MFWLPGVVAWFAVKQKVPTIIIFFDAASLLSRKNHKAKPIGLI
jgi:hypothetical protein